MSLKVLNRLSLNENMMLTVEGNCAGIKNGAVGRDEKGEVFKILSIGMTHYENPEHNSNQTQILIEGANFTGDTFTV